jgi:hypothetical protein
VGLLFVNAGLWIGWACVCVSAFACRCVFVYYVFGGCVSVLFGVLGYEYAFVDFCGFVGLHVLMYFTYELCNMI